MSAHSGFCDPQFTGSLQIPTRKIQPKNGRCPPWNDERLHHYHFRVYALDVDSLAVSGDFDGRAVEAAMAGHILDWAELTGTYTLNPAVS